MIQVNNLFKKFDSLIVLQDVSFVVEPRQLIVILGPSGTGKTVLLKSIVGLIPVDRGSVIIDGLDVQKANNGQIFDIRKQIGYVFQGAALFDSMSVLENIALPIVQHTKTPSNKIRERVNEILNIVGLPGKENLYPRSLSGGMKRLVSIGRALALDPKYILYDEPTTGLDPLMRDRIVELINYLKKNYDKMGIVVTHDLDTARAVGDVICMLKNGRIEQLSKIGKEFYG
ncbi:hypothetical protein A2Y85_05815 [candidate division WOR-3 bacterium RBG_13_43_14]|uniref:ABC transporter domain-containing protein n=1 Tax=candidate division WOR-3 bacterium RBG_13_43_14 TaxID=1802590 RepID=A0A1F4U565_UNCW3|nr:MAG: hypothetical protein A2Y85_05815 [candidate division WOR-3 bacterium RBG_13_43_14]